MPDDTTTPTMPRAIMPVDSWYSMVAEATPEGSPTRAKVNIYDAIGGWWGTNAAEFVAELDALDVDELEVHLNSPGGAVWDGMAIMNSLKAHRAHVTIVVDGLAASAASIVAMAGDEVVMAEGSQMMIHRASGGAWGNAAYLRDTAEILDKIDGNMAGIYARRAGGTRADWLELMTNETWYDADEAVAAGLADRADASLAATDAEAAFDLSAFRFAGRSKAPAPRPAAHLRAVAMAAGAPQTPVSSEPGGQHHRKEKSMEKDFLNGLRSRLGVTAEADEATILAALDETLAEQATTATLPEGVVAIDQAVLDGLKADAAAGRLALDQQDAARRDKVIAAALQAGKITANTRDQWRAALDENETTTTALLANMASVVPVDAKGYTGGISEHSDDDALYARAFGTGTTTKEA